MTTYSYFSSLFSIFDYTRPIISVINNIAHLTIIDSFIVYISPPLFFVAPQLATPLFILRLSSAGLCSTNILYNLHILKNKQILK